MNTQELMKQVMSRIEDAFTTLPDNHRAFKINGYEIIIKYDGWYKWHVTSINHESDDFEFFHECLQDAIDNVVQTVEDYHWIRKDKGKISRKQYSEFLQHGANYEW